MVSFSLFSAAVLGYGTHQTASLLGKWKLKSVSVPATGPTADKVKAMMKTITLTLAKDKSFSMILVEPMKGTWKLTGHTFALTITEMLGRKMSEVLAMARENYANDPSPGHKATLDELSKPMIFVLSADSKTLTLQPAPGKAGFVLMKA
jgi:hypothetical protein